MLVRSLGLFMVGLALGLLLAAGGLLAAGPLYQPRSVWVPLGLLLGAGLLGAVLTLQWQKLFTVLSTAVLGAAILVLAADYLLQASLLGLYVYPLLKASRGDPVRFPGGSGQVRAKRWASFLTDQSLSLSLVSYYQ
uniref:Transmembrane protein 198 n=1 Tax=Callorhinchus milii TaxID=7868 RepID=A0A4W3H1Q3_CALMI